MKKKEIMKHENWAVQCPQDYSTNEKWKEIVKWLNDRRVMKLIGGSENAYYFVLNGKVDCQCRKPECQLISIDEAHEMLFSAPVKYTIYQELKIQAFKREELNDKVFFDLFGVHPYLMKKKVTKNSKLIWNFCIPELDLIEYWVDGIKVSTMNVEEVKEFLTKIETK
jgi:hypothetical protein